MNTTEAIACTVMQPTKLVFDDGTSKKFWDIRVDGSAFTVTFGRMGTSGQTKTKSCGSPAAALKEASKLVAEKTKKGYRPAGGAAKGAAKPAPKTKAVSKVGTVPVPALLQEFQAFFAEQPQGALAIEGLAFEPVFPKWDPKLTPRLNKDGFVFFELGEGSMIFVLQQDGRTPVLLLDSDGGPRLLASSLEAFLVQWSKGATEIAELDGTGDFAGITPAGRRSLAAWLKAHKVTPPKGPDFDLDLYLSGGTRAVKAAPAPKPSKLAAGLAPAFAAIVDVVGRRGDDPVVLDLVTKVWKKKLPPSTTEHDKSAWIKAPPKSGAAGLAITHAVWSDLYPPVRKTDRAFIPYVQSLTLAPDWPEKTLPFGLSWKMDAAALTKALGAPRVSRSSLGDEDSSTKWSRPLDPARAIELRVGMRQGRPTISIEIAASSALVEPVLVPDSREALGLFVAWAATRGLLDDGRFAAHGAILAALKKRKASGAALVDAALARGLWWDHFRDLPGEAFGLRDRLWHYFADEPTLTGDLCKLFGKKKNKNGHSVPTLPSDSWAAVDRASKVLDERFKTWVAKKR